jgi:hypothetical protein
MTLVVRCREGDEGRFRQEAKPPIVLNEGGHDRRERRGADAACESKVAAAGRVGRSRAFANETRCEEDLRTTIPSRGSGRTESDSSHVPGNSNPNASYLHRQNERTLNDAVRFALGASCENRHRAYSHPRNESTETSSRQRTPHLAARETKEDAEVRLSTSVKRPVDFAVESSRCSSVLAVVW